MATSTEPAPAPPMLSRSLRILLGFAAAAIAVAGLRSAAGIVGPVVLALVLTIAVHPLRTYAKRFGLPPWAGLLIGVVGVYALLLLLAFSLVIAVARFATLLPEYQEEFNNLVQSGLDKLREYGVSSSQINDITSSFDVGKAVSLAGSVLSQLLSLTSNLLFIVTLLLFMAIDASHLPDQLERIRADRPAFVDAMHSFAHGTFSYLIVSTVFGLIVATLDTIFLAFTPVPVPLLWGLLAFITNYIPNIGFVVGLIPPAILGLLEGGPWLMILIIVVYSVLNFIIQSVIQPKFVGDTVGLTGTITFLSLVFWGWTLGPLGALLAVPLSLLVKAVLVEADPEARWLNRLLAGGPVTPDDKG